MGERYLWRKSRFSGWWPPVVITSGDFLHLLLFVVRLNSTKLEESGPRTQELALVNERLKGANEELEKLAVTDQLPDS